MAARPQMGKHLGATPTGERVDHAAQFPNVALPDLLLNEKELQLRKLVLDGDKGMNLKQVAALAKAAAMPLVPAKKKDGTWVVPSIVHWKTNHFSVILKKAGGRFLVRDPLLGGDF